MCESGLTGFGLAHLRMEGGYLHPDDSMCGTPPEWYTNEEYRLWYSKQLRLYESQFDGSPR